MRLEPRKKSSVLLQGIAPLFAICITMLLSSLLILWAGASPVQAFALFIKGSIGSKFAIAETLTRTIPLIFTGLAAAVAFKAKLWNIGAEGQVLVGAMATAAVMIYGADLPSWALYALCPIAGIAAGSLWGMIPAFFKAHWNTNETLFTLMLNYIAMQLVSFAIVYWETPKGSNHVGLINNQTKAGWLPSIGGNGYLLPIIIVMVLMVLMYLYMNYSKQGYEIAVVGESENTAHYAGINVKRVIIRTMAISGGIGGLAGYLLASGVGHTISTGLAGGRGFTAIIVAWLGKLNPFAMVFVAFFLVFMEKGAGQIATQFNLNENASDIITGIILFFILGCEFFIHYQVELRKREKEAAKA